MSPSFSAVAGHLAAVALACRLAASIAAAAWAAPGGGALDVVAVFPPRHAVAASTATEMTVTFDAAVDAATLGPDSVRVWGRWSGVIDGTLALSPDGRTVRFRPARPFLAGEAVTVSLSSAVTGRGGETLTGGHSHSFSTRTAASPAAFTWGGDLDTRGPGEGLAQTYGAYAGDLDGDGAPDLAMPTEVGNDVRVALNDGCGAFAAPPVQWNLPPGSAPSANEGADFDGDGNVDVATADIEGDSMSVLFGDGAGGFASLATRPAGLEPRGLAVLDADGDGDTDIVTAHRASSDLGLFLNQGDGTFGAMSAFEGGGAGETAVMAGDADGDGVPDLFVAHFASSQVTLLLGDGAGGFALSASRPVANGPWNLTLGDVDNDGHLDAVACGSTAGRVSILFGDGAGGLAPHVQLDVGNFPISVDLGDLDGDGDLDLVCSNFATDDWTVWINQGGGTFGGRFELPAIQAGSCVVLVDHDRNGMLDILGIDELADVVRIWEQALPTLPLIAESTCTATLRINNWAPRTGFAGKPKFIARAGDTIFLGVTAPPLTLFGIGVGDQLEPGVLTIGGPLHLGPPATVPFIAATDASGEALFEVPVPIAVVPGVTVTLQALVDQPFGIVMSNAEVVETSL